MTIKQDDPIRQAFAACSTGMPIGDWRGRIGTYETLGHAVRAFDGALAAYDLFLTDLDGCNYDSDSCRVTVAISGKVVGHFALAVLSWCKVPSGRYEVMGHIV